MDKLHTTEQFDRLKEFVKFVSDNYLIAAIYTIACCSLYMTGYFASFNFIVFSIISFQDLLFFNIYFCIINLSIFLYIYFYFYYVPERYIDKMNKNMDKAKLRYPKILYLFNKIGLNSNYVIYINPALMHIYMIFIGICGIFILIKQKVSNLYLEIWYVHVWVTTKISNFIWGVDPNIYQNPINLGYNPNLQILFGAYLVSFGCFSLIILCLFLLNRLAKIGFALIIKSTYGKFGAYHLLRWSVLILVIYLVAGFSIGCFIKNYIENTNGNSNKNINKLSISNTTLCSRNFTEIWDGEKYLIVYCDRKYIKINKDGIIISTFSK